MTVTPQDALKSMIEEYSEKSIMHAWFTEQELDHYKSVAEALRKLRNPAKDAEITQCNETIGLMSLEIARLNNLNENLVNFNSRLVRMLAERIVGAAGTIDTSYNVTSITDDGTGFLTATIALDTSPRYEMLIEKEIKRIRNELREGGE